ncbi:hypothetical protein AB0M20_22245 [Actinoplanes sp. NPDC051633]|uniref:hypothetical protein n=1 Tax=Actinoplanes sp. NPDC051633 TaxID=3155670 RepID=UPI003437B6C6
MTVQNTYPTPAPADARQLTIDLDLDHAQNHSSPERSHHWRRITRNPLQTAAVIAGAALLLASHAIGGGTAKQAPAAAAPIPANQTTTAQPHARLIVPETAVAGESLPVLAFRNSKLCGPAELRFDGAAIATSSVRLTAPNTHTYQELFMTIVVPLTARAGTHHLDLIGPVPAAHGQFCGDVPERQGTVASASMTIGTP